MKFFIHIILLCVLFFQAPLSGQKISDDSLMKIANQEIYNNPDYAISIGKKLLQKEKNLDKSIKIYLILSTAGIAKRNFDESLQYILKARELLQKTNDPKIHTSFLIAAAMQYQQMELFSKSLETLDEADEYLTKLPENSYVKHFETARSFALRGMIYKSQSNPEIALQEFLIAIRNFEKIQEKEKTYFNQSIIYYNIGHCYLNLNQPDNAGTAFMKSMNLAELIKAKSLEAFALKGLAEMNKQKHQNQEALELLIKAENLGKEAGDLSLNEGIYKEMADNYLAMGNPNLYQVYSRKYIETKFKREQSELSSINHAIDVHNMETQKKSNKLISQYNYFIAGLIIIGLFILSIFFYFVMKIRKQNKKYQDEIKQLIRD
ncbi:tetratricopeptide (TPR) repeat protein [Chryseobacterium sediminis]|uniref:Tetratricopeptide (TPR) repeat protein n=1 Tax=Chryseobacterium sediminis TaxID=1679494 RepID=A0ABR6PTQ7_9FLAO|nr:tetratricopeptide repeat protein [Chryseobacterium sediminis]MBB6329084.1 tetratricopeptide (TPR) repeat protein [Chryseobacterium sediminis]